MHHYDIEWNATEVVYPSPMVLDDGTARPRPIGPARCGGLLKVTAENAEAAVARVKLLLRMTGSPKDVVVKLA